MYDKFKIYIFNILIVALGNEGNVIKLIITGNENKEGTTNLRVDTSNVISIKALSVLKENREREDKLMSILNDINYIARRSNLSPIEVILKLFEEVAETLENLFGEGGEDPREHLKYISSQIEDIKNYRDILTTILKGNITGELEERLSEVENKASKLEASVLAEKIKDSYN